ncbi:MAG: hypothetical protein U9R25_18770 [Chloroflexota bacterium]|nr:hypothetical protein [Chloroflexota bacterium]
MTTRPPAGRFKEALLLAAITLGSFALRLIQLGRDSLWYDETVSVFLAGKPVGALIGHTARDIHPPGYYLLLRAWLALTGFPTGQAGTTGYRLEFSSAFLSLFFGVLLVPLIWLLARRLQLRGRIGLLAALLVAISPFAIWYSQEVRMYTLGASLGIVVLLATIPFLFGKRTPGALAWPAVIYALAAAAGMYTLYYFAFLLISVNLLLIPLLLWRAFPTSNRTRSMDLPDTHLGNGWRPLVIWVISQLGAALLYLPWLPVAWRPATDPPVPPWRTAPRFGQALIESWTGLSFGQSADPGLFWPLLLLTLGLVILAALAGFGVLHSGEGTGEAAGENPGSNQSDHKLATALVLVAAFGPGLLILLASLLTPLYHVRYLFTYWPVFALLLAMGLNAVALWRQPAGRWIAAGMLALLVLGSAWSLKDFWSDPGFASDDHRTAVRELAERWRPGDAILVNAGYAYPPLLTYWPASIAWRGRLSDYTADHSNDAQLQQSAVILQTGHLDGNPDLGWGDPRSDFYALPSELMRDQLDLVSRTFDRLWQYRIYDTVNDPDGLVRSQLSSKWIPVDDRLYNGEAFLRVQNWQSAATQDDFPPEPTAVFDDWLAMAADPSPVALRTESGTRLYTGPLRFLQLPQQAGQPVALSARLVDEVGMVWAVEDEPLGGNLLSQAGDLAIAQPLGLHIPPGTPPGQYSLAIVVYDPSTGQPLTVTAGVQASADQVTLGTVEVYRPAHLPKPPAGGVEFEGLTLVEASSPATAISPGDSVPVSFLWQANRNLEGERLVVVVQLLSEEGQVVASVEEQPVGGRYPTSNWLAGELVRDTHRLDVPASTPVGQYQLIVGLYRARDGQRLETSGSPLSSAIRDHVSVKTIGVH